jgi:(p)ppGpp synthase/HD superfamily hydrolase
MSTLERAIAIAAGAHVGQVDRAGQPYILHPLRVMLRMTSEAERIVAVLHDVVEDSDVTLELLRSEGFASEIISAVDALTKRKGESRLEAACRAKQNSIARIVKLADNTENMDLSRIAEPTERDFARLEEYKKVRSFFARRWLNGFVKSASDPKRTLLRRGWRFYALPTPR